MRLLSQAKSSTSKRTYAFFHSNIHLLGKMLNSFILEKMLRDGMNCNIIIASVDTANIVSSYSLF